MTKYVRISHDLSKDTICDLSLGKFLITSRFPMDYDDPVGRFEVYEEHTYDSLVTRMDLTDRVTWFRPLNKLTVAQIEDMLVWFFDHSGLFLSEIAPQYDGVCFAFETNAFNIIGQHST